MSASKDLAELSELIHNTMDEQGIMITYGMQHINAGCFHAGPGLGICEGLARTILNKYKIERI